MDKILDKTNSPAVLKNLSVSELATLSNEIREFLIDNVSRTGGHLASSLGVVELTLSLHYVFNTPYDKIIWDVGHQSYVHKILTGRKERFHTLRQLDGLSGFPKIKESIYDSFNTGHSSTSISAGLGFARARDLKNESNSVISVIGDGALTGGMAFEALNDAGRSNTNLIVILNDNEMSISKNVGGMSTYLSNIRTEPFYFKVKEDIDLILNKIPAIGKSAIKALDCVKGTIKYILMPGMIFEELGFKYLGPIDGHDFNQLKEVLTRAKTLKGPILIHICTQKGRGYTYAEEQPHIFHGISPFEIETGEIISNDGSSYSKCFGEKIVKLAKDNKEIVAITAAMPHGTGLELFSKTYSNRLFDVGIAEQHAVTFAAGLSINGLKPVVAIYSSFLQRAYDQVLHDVALQNLHVVFAIDRAGIVGEDGETHQGIYDISFLRHMPNIALLAPCDYNELQKMLEYALLKHNGPIALRYPRGKGQEKLFETPDINLGKSYLVSEGTDITILAVGNMVETAMSLCDKLKQNNFLPELIYIRFIKPLDTQMIIDSIKKTKKVITIEDNVKTGGFGSSIAELLSERNMNIPHRIFGFPDEPIPHGSRTQLYKKYGLDDESLFLETLSILS